MRILESSTPWVFIFLCLLGGACLTPFTDFRESEMDLASQAASDASTLVETVVVTPTNTLGDPSDDPPTLARNSGEVVYEGTPEALDSENPPPILNLSSNPPPGDMSCNCRVNKERWNRLSYEDPETCGKPRDYLEPSLKQFAKLDVNQYYTHSRNDMFSNAQIPRKCFVFAMKHTYPATYASKPYAICGAVKGSTNDFTRTTHKPCMSEPMIESVYNAYLDATHCFKVPPKFALAKFMNESGVVPNVVAPEGDAGIAQFTTTALARLQSDYKSWATPVFQSQDKACQRLLSVKGAMPMSPKEIIAVDGKRCGEIGFPPNPLRSLIYYGAFYHIIQGDVQRKFDNAGTLDKITGGIIKGAKTTEDLMKQSRIDTFDRNKILEILDVMGYNMGTNSVIYFREWLQYRQAKFPNIRISKDDLNMTIKPDPWQPFVGKTYAQIKQKFDNNGRRPMKFWEWLMIVKDKYKYVSQVKYFADKLDAQLGVGVCTERSFMEVP